MEIIPFFLIQGLDKLNASHVSLGSFRTGLATNQLRQLYPFIMVVSDRLGLSNSIYLNFLESMQLFFQLGYVFTLRYDLLNNLYRLLQISLRVCYFALRE